MGPTLWDLKAATAAKHRLYQAYMDEWWQILLRHRRWRRITYLEGFAGPGQYKTGEDGSPVFILERLLNDARRHGLYVTQQRVRLGFIEDDPRRFEHLQRTLYERFGPLKDLPVKVMLHRGRAGTDSEFVLNELGAWHQPIMAVYDSWGNVNVPLDVVRRIARNNAGEVIVTFGPNWFQRRQGENPDIIDTVYGGRKYWASMQGRDPEECWREWLAAYRAALGRAGFTYQLDFQVVPGSGHPLHLVYGTKHQKGLTVMKDAMWKVDAIDGMRFADPRTRDGRFQNQPTLFPDEELHDLILQRLAAGDVSLEGLGEWLLEHTARWRKRDAVRAVKDLSSAGQVAIFGRLSWNTIVGLPRHRRSA